MSVIQHDSIFSEFRIMKSDVESLDMDDHYRRVYQENMDILKQINVVSTQIVVLDLQYIS